MKNPFTFILHARSHNSAFIQPISLTPSNKTVDLLVNKEQICDVIILTLQKQLIMFLTIKQCSWRFQFLSIDFTLILFLGSNHSTKTNLQSLTLKINFG